MSDDSPTGPAESNEPTQAIERVEHTTPLDAFETVGPAGPTGGGRSRRRAVIFAVAVAVVTVLGGGAYAAYSFLDGGGPQPADVLPASTVAVVSVDLDPSAGQKIAAINSLRKFPALKKSLGLKADDDLREYVFDKLVGREDCKGLDFHDDVLPWLGKRAALAAVDLGEPNPSPAIVLQISDRSKAQKGFQALVDCTHPQDLAFAVGSDYLVASDTSAHARAVLDKGADKPLADNAAYRKWTDEAGDAGVVSFYVAAKAADYLTSLVEDFGSGADQSLMQQDFSAGSSAGSVGARGASGTVPAAFKEFKGLGGTVRFADGGMELSLAAGGLTRATGGATVGTQVGDLPGDTAIALGLGVPKDFAANLFDAVGSAFGGSDLVTEAESQTGLDLPEDLQTLLGDSVSLSLGGDAPDSLDALDGPDKLPVGLLVHGDAEKIRAIIAKAEDRLGMSLSDIPLIVDDAGGKVVLSPSDYGSNELLKDGDLGAAKGFRAAVPDADRASSLVYVDFDSTWRSIVTDLVAQEGGDSAGREFDENTAPLQSLGIASWADGGVSHTLVKISTD